MRVSKSTISAEELADLQRSGATVRKKKRSVSQPKAAERKARVVTGKDLTPAIDRLTSATTESVKSNNAGALAMIGVGEKLDQLIDLEKNRPRGPVPMRYKFVRDASGRTLYVESEQIDRS